MNTASGKSAQKQAGPPSLTRYAWLSILAALLTMALKVQAYRMTGSVGLLSDAAESLVNLAAALVALLMLSIAARPADAGHPFGHGKAEYFAGGFEGALILVAAAGIAWAAWERLWSPQPLAALDLGMAVAGGAAAVNLAVALVLLRAGKMYGSITLEADGRHLLSDVWTTAAVLSALGGITATGWLWLDPAMAFLAAAQIVWSGVSLIWRSIAGLLDAALPATERAAIEAILNHYRAAEGIRFHDLRTRVAGTQRFMTVHVLVPGEYSVKTGHDLLERLEDEIRQAVCNLTIVTHLEPLEDAASFDHDRLASDAADWPEPRGATTRPAKPGRRARKAVGRWSLLVGPILLFGGGAASMGLSDLYYADFAMSLSLIGLVLSLVGLRRGRHSN